MERGWKGERKGTEREGPVSLKQIPGAAPADYTVDRIASLKHGVPCLKCRRTEAFAERNKL